MEQHLIRRIVRVGNSAGVVLPKEWYGGEAKVELIKRPLNIKEDILRILSPYLNDILGIYLVGSYARNEERVDSDVDVLVITSDISKKIRNGKYEIIMISRGNLNRLLKTNIMPLLPMIREAKVILNPVLINEYLDAQINYNNLRFHITTTKSAINVIKAEIDLCKEEREKFVSDASTYSLILRFRGVHIIKCLIKGKEYNNKEFVSLVKDVGGSNDAYDIYLKVKDGVKAEKQLSIEEAEKLHSYIASKIVEQEKWAKRRR